jgi:hypothetical protein
MVDYWFYWLDFSFSVTGYSFFSFLLVIYQTPQKFDQRYLHPHWIAGNQRVIAMAFYFDLSAGKKTDGPPRYELEYQAFYAI